MFIIIAMSIFSALMIILGGFIAYQEWLGNRELDDYLKHHS